MDCEQALALLNAELDREAQPEEKVRLRAHLQECAACRASADAFRLQDADLRRLFASRQRAALAVADRVIAQLPASAVPTRRRLPWLPILLSAAAGFLLAVLVFRPWERAGDRSARSQLQAPVLPSAQPAVANNVHETEKILLAVANASMEFAAPGQQVWQTLKVGAEIPLRSRVRTGAEVRCEFRLADGSEIRLNRQTELLFATGRRLDLITGQVLARVAPAPAAFQVTVPGATITALGTEFDVLCKPAESVLTVFEGSTKVEGKGPEQLIRTGEAATIVDGMIHKQQVQNLLHLKSWTHEILMLKGRSNKELADRVNDLLAQLGHSKTEFLEEQEIRGLGDHCVLPLTRFIQSSRSQGEEQRRHMAARILADLAQPWSIPDLISLLGDNDPEIRYNAAKGLKRLTQQTLGHQPEEWPKMPPFLCQNTRGEWEAWWQKNKHRYPRAVEPQDLDELSSKSSRSK